MLKVKLYLWRIKMFLLNLPETLKDVVEWIRCLPMMYQILTGRAVAVRAWVEVDDDCNVVPHNFGDDINKPLLEALLGRKIVFVGNLRIPRPGIMAIGSLLPWNSTNDVYIWGTGMLQEINRPVIGTPVRVCAVRGPRTRAYLTANGVECPEIYGDPALLLPLIYSPHREERYKIGIIPHWSEIDLPHVQRYREQNPEVLFINFKSYDTWQSVIDQICSFKLIISSSLHGLIISDAYGVKNVYAKFSNLVDGGDYKYHDYMKGIGREWRKPLNYREAIDIDAAIEISNSYHPISFDSTKLLRAFPFPLTPKFKTLCQR